jgi:hypothetical protein
MPEGYFNPWRQTPERYCLTCRYAIGTPDGWHLWCERHGQVLVFPCSTLGARAGGGRRARNPQFSGFSGGSSGGFCNPLPGESATARGLTPSPGTKGPFRFLPNPTGN